MKIRLSNQIEITTTEENEGLVIVQCGFGVSAFNKRMTIYQQQGFMVSNHG